jgi:flagellar hook-associated protein FlgK
MDQNAVQQVNALQRELSQLNQQLRNVNTQLNQATTALNDSRERRLAAERNVATKQGTNVQQFTDLRYLYDMSRLNPPRFTWEAMMERVTAVAREKQLTSNVTISTGAAAVTVRYQPVSGGQVFSAANCTQCVVRLPVGNYNFWVETAGSAEPQRKAYLIFGESQLIQISQPIPSTH